MLHQTHAQVFVSKPSWVGYEFLGKDPFYQENVVAYKAGSTAVLYVNVMNNLTTLMNVSAVGIRFNWGASFNSTQANKTSPSVLNPGESRVFTITFEVPSVNDVSNLFLWDYKVFIEHVNATNGTVVEPPEIKTRKELDLPYFVVYSSDQAKSQKIARAVEELLKNPLPWNSTKAKILWEKAKNETSVAENYYTLGEFAKAASHYENALSLINQAFKAEESTGTRWEDVQITLLEAQTKQLEGWTNFLNGLSNMWTLIGVALVLFALGYIIRGFGALRKATPSL
jgi:tetratricopeptide (TPR) repeat protein